MKPELYDELDPYFWHYSRASREKVEGFIKSRKANIAEKNIWELEDSGVDLPRIDPYPQNVCYRFILSLLAYIQAHGKNNKFRIIYAYQCICCTRCVQTTEPK